MESALSAARTMFVTALFLFTTSVHSKIRTKRGVPLGLVRIYFKLQIHLAPAQVEKFWPAQTKT